MDKLCKPHQGLKIGLVRSCLDRVLPVLVFRHIIAIVGKISCVVLFSRLRRAVLSTVIQIAGLIILVSVAEFIVDPVWLDGFDKPKETDSLVVYK